MNLPKVFEDLVSKRAKVLVVGLGITGIETALFLHERRLQPVCVESKSADEYAKSSRFAGRLADLTAAKITVHFGVDQVKIRSIAREVSLCVISPGVPLSHPLLMEVQKKKIPVTGEFELGIELAGLPDIVVTGSNGKSTAVTLVDAMLKAGGRASFLCGNIGVPVIGQLAEILKSGSSGAAGDGRYLVVEASSYQLESCESLKPKVGAFLNLSTNHLERHGSMEAYFEAKKNLFVRQDSSDLAIVNMDDPYGERIADAVRSRIIGIGFGMPGAEMDFARIRYSRPEGIDRIILTMNGEEEVFECGRSNLVGRHNRYNIAAAVAIARSLRVPAAAVQEVIDSSAPLAHRIEIVAEKNSVTYVNDSKSTTVASTCAAVETALEYFPPKHLVLLLGGLAKKSSWEPVLDVLKKNESRLRAVICFGKDGGMLKRELKRVKIESIECPGLSDAVRQSMNLARHNDLVLLSPGCASFDEFKDFEERGDTFRKLVKEG